MNGKIYYGFEWDEDKNTTNKRKHGISFESAVRVFNDPCVWTEYDFEHSETEDVFKNMGLVNGVVVVAVWTTERGERTRLITARKANSREIKIYEKHAKDLQVH